MNMNPEERLKELNLELPPPPKPAGVYTPALVIGGLCYVSGHGPVKSDGSLIVGRVGEDFDTKQGAEAARQTGLAILATLRQQLGNLDRVQRLVKLFGMVNATSDFREHPAVINGCSQLMADVFGTETGIGTRSAVGMNSLPGGIAVEIEAVFVV